MRRVGSVIFFYKIKLILFPMYHVLSLYGNKMNVQSKSAWILFSINQMQAVKEQSKLTRTRRVTCNKGDCFAYRSSVIYLGAPQYLSTI